VAIPGGVWVAIRATGFKTTQGADGALARFALFVTKGLQQLCVAPIACLGDLDEHGAECSKNTENKKLPY